jgi:hypothetical protein
MPKVTPSAGLANNAQRLRRSALEVQPLALVDGLDTLEKVSIGIWKTCKLFPQIFGDKSKAMRFNYFLGGR